MEQLKNESIRFVSSESEAYLALSGQRQNLKERVGKMANQDWNKLQRVKSSAEIQSKVDFIERLYEFMHGTFESDLELRKKVGPILQKSLYMGPIELDAVVNDVSARVFEVEKSIGALPEVGDQFELKQDLLERSIASGVRLMQGERQDEDTHFSKFNELRVLEVNPGFLKGKLQERIIVEPIGNPSSEVMSINPSTLRRFCKKL